MKVEQDVTMAYPHKLVCVALVVDDSNRAIRSPTGIVGKRLLYRDSSVG
jgi:hypothetical protein